MPDLEQMLQWILNSIKSEQISINHKRRLYNANSIHADENFNFHFKQMAMRTYGMCINYMRQLNEFNGGMPNIGSEYVK